MPPTQTYCDDKKVYSVDMMFAYINMFKPSHVEIKISDLTGALENKGWYDEKSKKRISAQDVINNPSKYKPEVDRIRAANLKYPIIINNKMIVDGVHRLAKSHLLGKKTIKVYNFDNKLMKKFLISSNCDWQIVSTLEMSVFIELFCKRFCSKIG